MDLEISLVMLPAIHLGKGSANLKAHLNEPFVCIDQHPKFGAPKKVICHENKMLHACGLYCLVSWLLLTPQLQLICPDLCGDSIAGMKIRIM